MASSWYHLLLSAVLLALLSCTAMLAQPACTLYDLDSSAFPLMRARFLAFDEAGKVMEGIGVGDVRVAENGSERQVVQVRCPASAPVRLSCVLSIDGSASMVQKGRDSIVRRAASTWINALPLGYSECAVTSFNKYSHLNQDFTTDRIALLGAVSGLQFRLGTNYDTAFAGTRGGALTVASRGRFKKIVVLLSDGRGEGNEEEIVRLARQNHITIYSLALTYECSPILKNVAERTGGRWYEKIVSAEEVEAICLEILGMAQGGEPCVLEWNSRPGCDRIRMLSVELWRRTSPDIVLRDSVLFRLPASAVLGLSVTPSRLSFGWSSSGSMGIGDVLLTAVGSAITVRSISTTDPRFTVVMGEAPPEFTLQPGQTRLLRVSYKPTGKAYVAAKVEIESDACGVVSFAVTGGEPLPSPFTLHSPNGGERLSAGEEFLIEWSGVLSSTPVRLDYSTDAGATWLPVEKGATGHRHRWRVPNTPAERCLMRGMVAERSDDPIQHFTTAGAEVRAVAFSPDGRSIAAAQANPGVVYLWNLPSGDPIAAYDNDSRKLLALAYSPDGGRLLAVDSLKGPRLIDPVSGAGLFQFALWEFQDWAAGAYAGRGDHVVTISDRTAAIWNLRNGKVEQRLDHSQRLTAVGYGAGDTRLATGGVDGIVELWDIGALKSIRTLIANDAAINAVHYSSDGEFLVTAAEDGSVVIHAVDGGWRHSIQAHTGAAYSASFSPDGMAVLTSGADMVARIWDVATGAMIQELIGHTAAVHASAWSPDGMLVATGGDDGSLRIWEARQRMLGEDSSDTLWAIVAPRASASDVDMGGVAVGDTRDSTIASFLCNTGEVPVVVAGVGIEGAYAADFMVHAGALPDTLAPGGCMPMKFWFHPGGEAERVATLVIYTASDTMRLNVSGRGIVPHLEVLLGTVDFGTVEVGMIHDTIVTAIVRNTGKSRLLVQRARCGGADSASFSIRSGGSPFALEPGQMHAMELRFLPGSPGKARGSILFDCDGDGSSAKVELVGMGVCRTEARHRIHLEAPTEAVQPGSIIEIPLVLGDAVRLPPEGGRFTMSLRLNRRILCPLDTDAAVVQLDGDTLICYGGTWDGRSDTLRTLSFLVALGNAEATTLRLVSFGWDWACPVEVQRSGQEAVRVVVCREGGFARLFRDGHELYLKPPRPNPTAGAMTIGIEVSVAGRLCLHLVDMAGCRVATVYKGELPAGSHQLPVDLGDIPIGRYILVAETASAYSSGMIEVIR